MAGCVNPAQLTRASMFAGIGSAMKTALFTCVLESSGTRLIKPLVYVFVCPGESTGPPESL